MVSHPEHGFSSHWGLVLLDWDLLSPSLLFYKVSASTALPLCDICYDLVPDIVKLNETEPKTPVKTNVFTLCC